MDNKSLITKYRPDGFDRVLGHDSAVSALIRHIDSDTHSHGYLLSGPSGIGKTSIARLIGAHFDCEILDVDAAEHSGVEDMRTLKAMGEHRAMTVSGNRLILIDECQSLSKSAWSAVLKILEEPPDHLFFALCTTEFNKVPDNIVQRCYHVVLRPVHIKIIEDLIDMVVRAEGWTIPGTVLTMVADAATGQPRKALALLQAAADAETPDELRRIIELQEASGAVLDLARAITKGANWDVIKKIFPRISDDEFERAGSALARYIIQVMITSDEQHARNLWMVIDDLTRPMGGFDRKVQFMAALGRILWS